jgi:hypothetical protein
MDTPFEKLLDIINHFEEANIWYTLLHMRPEAIMILTAAPGERWEIEVLDDGSVDVEIFRSDGSIQDEQVLDDFINNKKT